MPKTDAWQQQRAVAFKRGKVLFCTQIALPWSYQPRRPGSIDEPMLAYRNAQAEMNELMQQFGFTMRDFEDACRPTPT